MIDVGEGWALAFKIESHNHPSAVEPYQGAATGVGGILRDVFTMGARPVATLNSLHFGDLDRPRNRYLFEGVVRGLGDYGNCVGIPSTGGEVYFDRGYADNPIVNAMCLGLMRTGDLIRGTAQGVGNTLMAVGARTGRDGIHGATFASDELSEGDDESSRPQVQVGDPFTEKLLLEASLELIASGHIVGIQDMGAAGLTSSGAEMAGRSGTGRRDGRGAGAGARERDDAVRDPALGIAGADAGGGRGGARGRRARHSGEVGARSRDHRAGHRHRLVPGAGERRAGGRHSGGAAHRGLPVVREAGRGGGRGARAADDGPGGGVAGGRR